MPPPWCRASQSNRDCTVSTFFGCEEACGAVFSTLAGISLAQIFGRVPRHQCRLTNFQWPTRALPVAVRPTKEPNRRAKHCHVELTCEQKKHLHCGPEQQRFQQWQGSTCIHQVSRLGCLCSARALILPMLPTAYPPHPPHPVTQPPTHSAHRESSRDGINADSQEEMRKGERERQTDRTVIAQWQAAI